VTPGGDAVEFPYDSGGLGIFVGAVTEMKEKRERPLWVS
jgi:hypothetical protein